MNVNKTLILNTLMQYKKFASKAEFARFLEITPQNLSQWLKRNTFDISIVGNKFPEVNHIWLLTGEGEMLKGGSEHTAPSGGSDYRLVPLINLDAVGGMHASNDQHDVAQYTLGLVPFPHAEEGDVCMRVTGNSMIPTYPPGSILLLRAVPDWYEYFGYGHTFVIGLKDGRRILKEVTRSEEDPRNQVLCVSHNKDFPAEELPKSMIVSVYKVVMSLTNEGF